MIYLGIDPGKTGGVAILKEDGTLELHTIPVIGKEVDLKSLNEIIFNATREEHIVCLEDVHAIPGTGAGSNFEFGRIKGLKEGMLVGMQATYVMLAPKTWQKTMWAGVPLQKKAAGGNDTKATSLLAARRWFPKETFLATARSSKPHDGLVDSALMAMCLKLTYGKAPK
jgi:crossover junction endodeoxyribonuclease RuvC